MLVDKTVVLAPFIPKEGATFWGSSSSQANPSCRKERVEWSMQFNAFVWELYKESERGRKALERWSRFQAAREGEGFINPFFETQESSDSQTTETMNEDSATVIKTARDYARKFEVKNLESALEVFEGMVHSNLPVLWPNGPDKDDTLDVLDAEGIADLIYPISLGLHIAHPNYFIPYGFVTTFNLLERISEQFDLPLPSLPGKRDKVGRALLYGQVVEAFHEFRKRHNLKVVEMCAFLYDFALRFARDDEDDLPAPSKVWPIIAGAYSDSDFEWIEKATPDDKSPWNGNINVRRGDILLMYSVTPHQRIHSIWRAITDGFNDPFCHYYSTVWIGNPIKTVPVAFKEMKAHPLLAKNAAVRTHMRGPDSGPFTLEEYEAILDIIASKDQDISLLPKPQRVSYLPSDTLQDERDVEVQLVEPLLERFGYAPDDWTRQMPVRMGRGERVYPDYAFGAVQKRGEESAAMVLEAKFSISTHKELQEAYFQMASYALRLQAKVAVLAAREGVWVFGRKRGGFGLESHTHHTWDDLTHPDVFRKLSDLMRP